MLDDTARIFWAELVTQPKKCHARNEAATTLLATCIRPQHHTHFIPHELLAAAVLLRVKHRVLGNQLCTAQHVWSGRHLPFSKTLREKTHLFQASVRLVSRLEHTTRKRRSLLSVSQTHDRENQLRHQFSIHSKMFSAFSPVSQVPPSPVRT